jgi:hypothetical protein
MSQNRGFLFQEKRFCQKRDMLKKAGFQYFSNARKLPHDTCSQKMQIILVAEFGEMLSFCYHFVII